MGALQELIKKQVSIREEMQATGKAALKEAFSEFFDKHPEVVAIFWTQYTPYFNDGDVCVFNVHEINMELTEDFCQQVGIEFRKPNYEDRWVEGYSDYSLRNYDSGGRGTDAYGAVRPGSGQLVEDFSDLRGAARELTDLFLAAFGDHTFVKVNREGFAADHYEHD